jgi:hypothetical protein
MDPPIAEPDDSDYLARSFVDPSPFMYNATVDGVALNTSNDYVNPNFDLNVNLLDLQQSTDDDKNYDQFVQANSMPHRLLCQEYLSAYC